MHALEFIFQLRDLKFRHRYEAITAEAQQISQVADVDLKAEVRNTRRKSCGHEAGGEKSESGRALLFFFVFCFLFFFLRETRSGSCTL